MKADLYLKRDVEAELAWEPALCARDIDVTVQNGRVTLSGCVNSYAQKLAAERAVLRVGGGHPDTESLMVRLPAVHSRADDELADYIATALSWNVALPATRITVRVCGGWVTLTGEVEWRHQREAAQRAVGHLAGVRGVTNRIIIGRRAINYVLPRLG
ncbi:MAG TPA: BON domain-containing protein [Gemmatimonadaceae bacterium]|nr:BON domain-containing protein [Gemmatimonadaceae bacterium]